MSEPITKTPYTNPFTTVEQQIKILKEKGLEFDNEIRASSFLKRISYFKFRAYTKEYIDETQKFIEYTTFEQIVELYYFDSKLRAILFNAIEDIEIAVKTKLIEKITPLYGNNWYQDYKLFDTTEDFNFSDFIADLYKKLTDKSAERYIKGYYLYHNIPEHPPIWMVMETLTLGKVSKLYCALKDKKIRGEIAQEMSGYIDEIFSTWLKNITYVRNLCAHNSVIWDRDLVVRPRLVTNNKAFIAQHSEITNEENKKYNKIYPTLCLINHITRQLKINGDFKHNILDLINSYPAINLNKMGFTSNWRNENLWLDHRTH